MPLRQATALVLVATMIAAATAGAAATGGGQLRVREFSVPAGTHPHDIALARGGGVWYTAQHTGRLGLLNPKTGRSRLIALGSGSAPHGVIVGADGAPWITDGGLDAIAHVDPRTGKVRRFPLPACSGYANLNAATFDRRGVLWFTGQSGIYGRVDPKAGRVRLIRTPRGAGPYGITTTPSGDVYYASLAGSYLGRIDTRTSKATVLLPPTAGQGARRAWSDSRGRIWISEWNAGKVGMYDPPSSQSSTRVEAAPARGLQFRQLRGDKEAAPEAPACSRTFLASSTSPRSRTVAGGDPSRRTTRNGAGEERGRCGGPSLDPLSRGGYFTNA